MVQEDLDTPLARGKANFQNGQAFVKTKVLLVIIVGVCISGGDLEGIRVKLA